MVKVFTKNGCRQCAMTKKIMAACGIDFEEININNNPEFRDKLIADGFGSMPVVMTDDTSWAGFQPDKIHSLTN